MNTTLSTAPGRHDHPPQPSYTEQSRPTRHVSMLDRLALHAGIALIKWGRRPHSTHQRHAIDPVEWRQNLTEQRQAHVEREQPVNEAMQFALRLR